MIINNTEALKSWLIVVLEPLCDADSSALARYVLALLKKDKPEKELKRVMVEQLDVFLGEETKPFVERLFNAISSEEYLKTSSVTTIAAKKVGNTTDTSIDTNLIKIENRTDSNATETQSAPDETISHITVEETVVAKTPTEETKTKDLQKPNQKPNDERSSSTHHSAMQSENVATPHQTTNEAVIANASVSQHVRSASPPIRAVADKENQPKESRRRRASLRSRSRSRSRSNDRFARRSRSRDRRINEREKNQRQFRNKSPPNAESRHISVYDRRRGGAAADRRRASGANMNAEDRFGGNNIVDNRKGPHQQHRPSSKSPSPSADRQVTRSTVKDLSPGRRMRSSPERHHHTSVIENNEMRQRCRDFDEKGYCVRGETCPWDHGINPVVFEGINNTSLLTMSLREYNPDAPDLWSRPAPNTSLQQPAVPGAMGAPPTSINPFTGTARPGTTVMTAVGGPTPNGPGSIGTTEYTRAAGTSFRAAAPILPFPFNPAGVTTPLQRELIPIPVVDGKVSAAGGEANTVGKRRFELEDTVAIADGPTKRKLPINSRLGPRVSNMQSNCSLELRKVPRGLNTIAHLNNHFAKFGKIVNIQVSYDGDPEAAIVTFSTHAEANVAYRSTEAVLNNRFIKVFWHTQEVSTSAETLPITSNRKNSHYHINNIPAIPTPNADSAKTTNTAITSSHSNIANQDTHTITTTNSSTESNTDATAALTTTSVHTPVIATHVQPPSMRLKNASSRSAQAAHPAVLRKKQEEQAKAVVQLANGLRKRKQELLQSYLKQMKSALEIVERCEPNDPQRAKTLETIKTLQEAIDKLRKEIANEQEQLQAQIQNQQLPAPKKTKEQQKKELLDIELELFAQQQDGNDTTAIQKRLEELQRSLGISSGAQGVTAGHGSPLASKAIHFGRNVRGRASFPDTSSTRVDRRPKTIVVTGFAKEDADFLLGHFKHFGEITKHDVDRDIPQLILSYATRINAEQAIVRGKVFKEKRLQISWAPVVTAAQIKTGIENKSLRQSVEKTVPSNLPTSAANDKTHEMENNTTTDTLPELRLEDEEEDDESEDRSWRR